MNDSGKIKTGNLHIQDVQGNWDKYYVELKENVMKWYANSDMTNPVGEVDLSTCLDVAETSVQMHHGFQICTPSQTITMAAISVGLRRSWVLAIKQKVENQNEGNFSNQNTGNITESNTMPILRKKRTPTQVQAVSPTPMNSNKASFTPTRSITERLHSRRNAERRRAKTIDITGSYVDGLGKENRRPSLLDSIEKLLIG